MMLQDLNHAVLQSLQKNNLERHLCFQDDFINKSIPFAKLSPLVCWWIWIFLSFQKNSNVKDFIPIGTLCGCGITGFSANTPVLLSNSGRILTFKKPLLLHMCPVMSWSCLGNTTAQFLMLL